jgi:hypothetical protein
MNALRAFSSGREARFGFVRLVGDPYYARYFIFGFLASALKLSRSCDFKSAGL